jgi:hypothetical protein
MVQVIVMRSDPVNVLNPYYETATPTLRGYPGPDLGQR